MFTKRQFATAGLAIVAVACLIGWFVVRPWFYEIKTFDDASKTAILDWLDTRTIPTDDTLAIPYVKTKSWNDAKDSDYVTLYKLAFSFNARTATNAARTAIFATTDGASPWTNGFDGTVQSVYVIKLKKSAVVNKSFKIPDGLQTPLDGVPTDVAFSLAAPSQISDTLKFVGTDDAISVTALPFFASKQVCDSAGFMPAPRNATSATKFYNVPALEKLDSPFTSTTNFATNSYVQCVKSASPLLKRCDPDTNTYRGNGQCAAPGEGI